MDLSGSMRMGTCLGFDFYPTTRTTNNPDTLVPAFGHYSAASSGLIGPSTNRTSGDDSYTISPSNTTASNTSYSLTYVNNFYQNAAYATPLIRAFDSYSSSDGGTPGQHQARRGRNCRRPPTPRRPGVMCPFSSRAAPPPTRPTSRTFLAPQPPTSCGSWMATRRTRRASQTPRGPAVFPRVDPG